MCGLWWLVWIAPTVALDPRKTVTQYGQDVFQEGLPQQSIHAVLQTRDGYLWCATYEGVARFNGVSFTVFDRRNTPALKSNSVWTLCEDRAGTLWLGTLGGGVTRYQDGVFSTLSKADGLPSDFVYALCEGPDGAMWFGTDRGLGCFRQGQWTTYAAEQGLAGLNVRALCFDRHGQLWVGTEGGGAYRFVDGRFAPLTAAEGGRGDTVYAIRETTDGTLWFACYGVGLVARRGEQINLYTEKDGLPSRLVWTLWEDRDHALWIGTDGGGGARLYAGRFEDFTTRDGLTQNFVRSLYEDREGSLWFGTNAGLTRLRDTTVTVFGVSQGLPSDSIRSICEDRDGRLWIGTDGGGVCRLNGRQVITYDKSNGLTNEAVRAVFPDRDGGVWVGTNGGGACLIRDGQVVARYDKSCGLSNDAVYAICQDATGDVWIGTYGGGLNRLHAGNITIFTVENGLPNNTIRCLLPNRDGGVWIGTNGGGLSLWRDGTLTTYSTAQGLPNDTVFALHQASDGTLWIGTEGGLSRLRQGQVTSATSRVGLHDDKIFHILADADGFFWMSCNRGIFRVRQADLEAVLDGIRPTLESKVYGIPDGMKTRQCNGASSPAGWVTRQGELWFPTSRGAVRIAPRELVSNPLPPPVWIERVVVNGVPQVMAPTAQAFAEFPQAMGRVEFEYAGLSFLIPARVRFRFRLEGYDADWVESGDRRVAFYTNLSAGRYLFRVQACNNDGVWNEVGATYAFYLRPPLWRRWWMLALYGLGAAVAIYGGVRWRLGTLERRAARLESIVAERTAEVVRQRDEIAVQRMEMLDSIRYAERIQRSMLDYRGRVAVALAEHFILFLPKDIVSGDFYWFDQVADGVIVAVADCTGHGVPGALLSMVGSAALTQTVRGDGVTEPALILERLDVSLRQTLQSSEDTPDAKPTGTADGLEIALCHLDVRNGLVTFAGAGRPLYYHAVEEGLEPGGLIRQVRGNRRVIGGNARHQGEAFVSHQLRVGQGLTLYLASDGLTDQPGGEQGRGYGTKRLRALLGAHVGEPMPAQRQMVLADLRAYQGDVPQRDDITLVGIHLRPPA
ncbi:SpoIIE family protein phosphatase [Chloracidobacterium validum]|uniref:SpoIIE family protein phosphatase n=1 Tax=Chloracidobacterium validum TaxID=2821543 RepID=A0ABX8BF48_9BACT|nr:two-component regulator propeller domain-containing protein [Chloracidobacterium validum]QUW04611.1 SpoIIE family protein phosphatase [Chloracidobacterium validum]